MPTHDMAPPVRPEQIQTDQSLTVEFFVPGKPAPQGSKTGFVVGKRAIITDANASTLKPWRATVATCADLGVTFTAPVAVTIVFVLPKPQRPRWHVPAVKPDIDKLARAVLDGITDGGLIEDDARVVDLHVTKEYGARLGALISVREWTGEARTESAETA